MIKKILLILILFTSPLLNAIQILNCTARIASFSKETETAKFEILPGATYDLNVINSENLNFTFAGLTNLTVAIKDITASTDIVLTEIHGRICAKFIKRDGTTTEPNVEYNRANRDELEELSDDDIANLLIGMSALFLLGPFLNIDKF